MPGRSSELRTNRDEKAEMADTDTLIRSDLGSTGAVDADNQDETELLELEREMKRKKHRPASAVLMEVVERVCSLTRADGAVIAALDLWGLVCRASTGSAPMVGSRLQHHCGLTNECFVNGHVVVCDDAEADSRVEPSLAKSLQLRSAVAVPIMAKGSVLGVLEVLSSRPSAFSPTHVTRLLRVALLLAPILARAGSHASPVSQADEEQSISLNLKACQQALSGRGKPFWTALMLVSFAIGFVLINSTHLFEVKTNLSALSWRVEQIRSAALSRIAAKTTKKKKSTAAPVPDDAKHEDAIAQDSSALRFPRRDGILLDHSQAARWFQQAAKSGNSTAQFETGAASALGRGLTTDKVRAHTWLILASASGDRQAKRLSRELTPQLSRSEIGLIRWNLGEIYAHGNGVPVDKVTAYMWLLLAEEAGETRSTSAKSDLAASMSDGEISEANARASRWLQKHRK
jgi:TPR repeat protein